MRVRGEVWTKHRWDEIPGMRVKVKTWACECKTTYKPDANARWPEKESDFISLRKRQDICRMLPFHKLSRILREKSSFNLYFFFF